MIAIIANPNALHFNKDVLKNIASTLERKGINVDLFFTKKAKDGTKIANQIASKYHIIAAYGGDGILNEIVNANLGTSAMGILPAGTTNVLAINLGIELNPKKASELFKNPKFIEAYPACINNKRFLLMASAGFDAEAVKNVNEKFKKISGKLSYFWAGIISYISYLQLQDYKINVKINNKKYTVRWIIISKAKKYAGNFSISSSVDIDVPLLDICLFKPVLNCLIDFPLYNLALFSGMHLMKLPFTEHIITNSNVEIEKSNIQIDGDFFGYEKANIRICKEPIRIVIP